MQRSTDLLPYPVPDHGYLWLDGHPKAGTPPKGTPLRSNDIEARIKANEGTGIGEQQ